MDTTEARHNLEFIEDVLRKTKLKLDPHAFHFVHWGAIVFVWYPIANWFQLQGNLTAMATVGIAGVAIGVILTVVREMKLAKNPRFEAEDTILTKKIMLTVYPAIAAAAIFSAIGPATGFIAGENVPIIWGLAYAMITWMVGVTYERDFMIGGAAIFAGCVVAVLFSDYAGFILGPLMGLGTMVPGIRAENRVRNMLETGHGNES